MLADASNKLTDPDEDEQVLRHRGESRHFRERLVLQDRLVTENFAEAGPTVALPGYAGLIDCGHIEYQYIY